MSRTSFVVAIGAAFVVGCVAASQVIVPAYAQQPTAKKWEQFCSYRRAFSNLDGALSQANEDLKAKGGEGWELATTSVIPDTLVVYCFKRPAP